MRKFLLLNFCNASKINSADVTRRAETTSRESNPRNARFIAYNLLLPT